MTSESPRISSLPWLIAAIAIAGVLVSAAAALTVRGDKLALIGNEFEQRAAERSMAIELELTMIVDHVESVAALYQTYGEIDRRHFSSFAGAMIADHPNLQAEGFDSVVARSERRAHEEAMHEEGWPGYRITERDAEGRLIPAGDRDRYVAVVHVEPLLGNQEALGYDIASDPVRAATLEHAMLSGRTTVTGRLRLVQEHTDQFGALICAPIYHGAVPDNAAARRESIRGFAVGVVRYGDIVGTALSTLRPAGIFISLSDETAAGEELLHDHPVGKGGEPKSSAHAEFGPVTKTFEIGDRRFIVRATPTSIWTRGLNHAPIAVFAAGLLATALLGGYVVWQSTGKRRLKGMIVRLEHAEQRQAGFGRMLDDSHDELFVFDAATLRFVHANRGARSNLGYSMDELRRMTPLDLKPRMDELSFAETIQPLREGARNKVVFTTVHRRKDGSEYDVEVHLQLSTFDHRPAFVAMILDITDRKRIDERLRQSQRIEALGTLAGGIAHDFNNLLTAIMGYSELSRDEVPPGSPLASNMTEIMRASERARDVVRRILTFSRQHTVERRTINVADLVSETLQLMRVSLRASIEIRRKIDRSCAIEGDAAQIHQVLMNLCTNAGHAIGSDAGVLEVTLDAVELDASEATRYGDLDPGRYVRIVVRDSGPGISPEVAEHAFDPFFTTKPLGEGSGMGLAVAHGIVTAHEGTIRLVGRPGEGTSVEVLLPRTERDDCPGQGLAPDVHGGDETILLVDDECAILEVLHEVLARAGYTVESYADPDEALDRVCSEPDRFDLVITDYTMPKLSGAELAQRVRKVAPDLPLILVSGFGELLDEEALCRCGVTSVMSKPPMMSELRLRVRSVLDDAQQVDS